MKTDLRVKLGMMGDWVNKPIEVNLCGRRNGKSWAVRMLRAEAKRLGYKVVEDGSVAYISKDKDA